MTAQQFAATNDATTSTQNQKWQRLCHEKLKYIDLTELESAPETNWREVFENNYSGPNKSLIIAIINQDLNELRRQLLTTPAVEINLTTIYQGDYLGLLPLAAQCDCQQVLDFLYNEIYKPYFEAKANREGVHIALVQAEQHISTEVAGGIYADVDVLNYNLVYIAVYCNQPPAEVATLLAKGANYSYRNWRSKIVTAPELCIILGRAPLFECFLDHGVTSNQPIEDGLQNSTLLSYSFKNQSAAALRMLLARDPSIDFGNLGFLASYKLDGKVVVETHFLSYAAKKGWLEGVQIVIEHTQRNEHRLDNTDSALSVACRAGHVNVFDYLFKRYGYKCEQSPLFTAARCGNLHMAQYAFQNDLHIGVTETDKYGNTMLHQCELTQDSYDIVKFLLANGAAEIINQADEYGYTPLMSYCFGNRFTKGYRDKHEYLIAKIKNLLLHHGAAATIHHKNKDGNTALMLAAKTGSQTIVRVLLAAGANAEERDPRGQTMQELATQTNLLRQTVYSPASEFFELVEQVGVEEALKQSTATEPLTTLRGMCYATLFCSKKVYDASLTPEQRTVIQQVTEEADLLIEETATSMSVAAEAKTTGLGT